MNKNYKGSVITVADDTIGYNGNIPFKTGKEAKKIFLELCRSCLSNFDEYTKEDINVMLEDGYGEIYGRGFIAICWF